MSWIELFFYLICMVAVIQLVRLIISDCDLVLQWRVKYGIKSERLLNEVVWITGSSSGIGEYLAYDLARLGCRLILSARRKDELERVKKQCLVCGKVDADDILVLPMDLVKTETHKDAVKIVLEKFQKIDILVNNAGRSQRCWIKDTPLSVHKDLFDINLFAMMSLTTEVLPSMIERRKGHIVVTNSIQGKMGFPFCASYSSSKHALQGWYDSLRIELLEDNIFVTSVFPGPTHSNLCSQALTEHQGKSSGKTLDASFKQMSTSRFAELMTAAIANQLDEVWISQHPTLLFCYIAQYMPQLQKWIAKKVALKMARKSFPELIEKS